MRNLLGTTFDVMLPFLQQFGLLLLEFCDMLDPDADSVSALYPGT